MQKIFFLIWLIFPCFIYLFSMRRNELKKPLIFIAHCFSLMVFNCIIIGVLFRSLILTPTAFASYNLSFSIIACVIALLVDFSVHFLLSFLGYRISIQKADKRILSLPKKIFITIKNFLVLPFVILSALAFFSSHWVNNTFGLLTPEQLMYNLQTSFEGTDPAIVWTFIREPLFYTVTTILLVLVFIYNLFRINIVLAKTKLKDTSNKEIVVFPIPFFGTKIFSQIVLLSCFLFVFALKTINFGEYIAVFASESPFIETFYVEPTEVELVFPKEKRNLIYIYAESLESSFLSKELGGLQDDNLLPNLSHLALNGGVNFSHSEQLGGAYQFPGTNWTMAGLFAQTSGLPLKIDDLFATKDDGINQGLSSMDAFMPGVTALGDILANEGYTQTLMIGSDAVFGGRKDYFEQHGNYTIFEYSTALEQNLIPLDYRVWWGFEDEKLFEFAQKELLDLSRLDAPFNFTLLTADTHFPNGYINENTPLLYDRQYANVIAYSDLQLCNFIAWIMEQDFYENTTIVLCGDHLSMDRHFFPDEIEANDRNVFNLILNPVIQFPDSRTKNRLFGTFDLFPTTLSALGVTIPGNRLALGTDLFSDSLTLTEEFGVDEVTHELTVISPFYNQQLRHNVGVGYRLYQ